MTGNEDRVRSYFYVKVTYSNGNVVRYKELPMDIYEQGVKDHYIRDLQPLSWWETLLVDLGRIFHR